MTESQRLYMKIAVVVLLVGTLATALIWGMRGGPVSAAPAALTAHKSVSASEVAPGQTVKYTIVVTNTAGVSVANRDDWRSSGFSAGQCGPRFRRLGCG